MPKSRIRKKQGNPLDKRRKSAVARQNRRNIQDMARTLQLLDEYEAKLKEEEKND